MGDINQLLYLKQFLGGASGAILEIGSKDYGSTADFRTLFPGHPYTGVDLEAGKGVDEVVDLTKGIGSLKENHYGLIICCSVLEHVDKPWLMAETITRLSGVGGKLFMSVPWVWRYHAYPDDYFRFSHRGIMSLFPGYQWGDAHFSSYVPGEIVPVIHEGKTMDNEMAVHMTLDQPNKVRKYLPYLMINMIGTKT